MRSWSVMAAIGVMAACAGVASADVRGDTVVVSLKTAVEKALLNSQVVEVARLQVEEANQDVRSAWSEIYPDIVASASYGRNLKPQQGFLPAAIFDPDAPADELVPIQFGSDNTWNAGLALRQPLIEADLFIGLGATNKFKELQSERYRGTSLDVLLTTREVFLAALFAEEDLRIIEERLRRIASTRDEARALFEAGLGGEFDVITLEVQLANIEPDVLRFQNLADIAKRRLLIEIGTDPTIPISIQGNLGDLDLTGEGANSLANEQLLTFCGDSRLRDRPANEVFALAFENRSDLRQLRMNIELEEKRLSANKAEYFPTLSLFSRYDVVAQENGSPDFFGESETQRTTTAVVGLQLDFPIFEGFRRDAQVKKTRAIVLQNQTELTRLEHEAVSDIERYVADVTEARARAIRQKEAVELGRRGFQIATAEFQEGIGTRLQVTEAEVTLSESEFNYARAVFDYLRALSQLDQATGTVSDGFRQVAPQLAIESED